MISSMQKVALLAILAQCVGFSLLDLGEKRLASPEEHLHNLEPWTYRMHADIVIDSRQRWRDLDMGHCKARTGNVLLVELEDMCHLPTEEERKRITTEFILFGPFGHWHYANFGPFTELDALYGKDLVEGHLSIKLGRCNPAKTEADIYALLDHPRLVHWVAHQHSVIQHDKVHALPLGFGFHNRRMGPNGVHLNNYKNDMLDFLRESKDVKRDKLLLCTMQIHTNIFGEDGDDPRTQALRNLSAIRSLRQWAVNRRFDSTRAYWSAVRAHKFVLSPWGWGPDCFRHYEAVALGTVPILLSDYLQDKAVRGLPVLVVEQWSDLNEEMLEREYTRIHANTSWNLERLLRDSVVSPLFHVASESRRVCK